MEQLTRILDEATASIGPEYFLLPIDGADPVYRERVYCYELYHQMRHRWPDDRRYILNGEVDKSAHPYFRIAGQRPKPDLLVHQPGSGRHNHAVIEVKASSAPAAGIRKDLETLSLFRSDLGYERAIYLIYGLRAHEALAQVLSSAGETKYLAPIEVWVHLEATSPATLARNIG
jgi:hypothetical protein